MKALSLALREERSKEMHSEFARVCAQRESYKTCDTASGHTLTESGQRVRVRATARWIAKGEPVTISKREFGCVALSVFLCVPALAQTRQGEPPSLTDALPLEVSVLSHRSGWQITFVPTGAAHAQFGSGFGDGGEVPAGTVDYAALVKSLSTAPATTALPPAPIDSKSLRAPRAPLFQVGFRWPCAESFSAEQCVSYGRTATAYEEDVLERLLVRLNRQWKSRYGSSERLKELLRRHPILSKEKQKDEPSLSSPSGNLSPTSNGWRRRAAALGSPVGGGAWSVAAGGRGAP